MSVSEPECRYCLDGSGAGLVRIQCHCQNTSTFWTHFACWERDRRTTCSVCGATIASIGWSPCTYACNLVCLVLLLALNGLTYTGYRYMLAETLQCHAAATTLMVVIVWCTWLVWARNQCGRVSYRFLTATLAAAVLCPWYGEEAWLGVAWNALWLEVCIDWVFGTTRSVQLRCQPVDLK